MSQEASAETRAQSQEHWNRYPCGINLPIGTPGTKEFYTNLRRFKYEFDYPEIVDYVRFSEGRSKKVLDAGCGLGTDSQTWLENGALLTSVDFAQRAVDETNQRLEMFGLPQTAQRASVLELPFPDETFDVYYSWGVLMHTGNVPKGLSEAYRVTKKGGEIIGLFYNKNSFSYRIHVQLLGRPYDDGAPITEFFTNRDLAAMLSRAGFKMTELKNYYFIRPNVSRLGNYIPAPLERLLGKAWGACTYIRAVKA
ncbi:class I SAM-dependent methyltransferase [Bradyrhizobium sp. WSM4349]|uniref:class I SAM-dependent methyltransferase n=1 Tax=Bradyrhizobium sp. WSM4349 TaxID=1040988 RepID=UPI00037752D2|nr:class I SAM-dependent methyltransferase [Bradyrhizobium sp. WSM4349]